ncbi:unnamed protein product [Dracunculus medinensis]|uniref:RNA cytidine acetyltransferase n=1 Tax=Dracunculus medinensis TaxID=318479 RepID=A0A0N4U5J0_DRAME|nr:unnamed protein product [Dracunculus medinensis]
MRTKLDNRIRILIENGVISGHRSMFVIIGEKGKDQVVLLHHILSKSTITSRPTVLWCYKKELGFSSHRKKRMKELKKKMKNGPMDKSDDPFDIFVSSTIIKYCYYSETHKILGNTFGMLILQDFEAITPNLLAQTVETVEGGGIIVLLMKSVNSLRQLYTMTMDVHSRFRTKAHTNIVPRFNERFILSFASCKYCAVVDDQLNVLPLSSHILKLEPISISKKNQLNPNEEELIALKSSLADTKPIGPLLNKCKTNCQAKALLRLLDVITEKNLQVTCSVTAARGRGKSAALGLAIAGAIGFGYTNIFVTSPSPDNLKTLFEFIVKGFEAMGLEEHLDFELIQSVNSEFNKALVRINVFKKHRQVVQYIDPRDWAKTTQAELIVIDEAAAIPLPIVKNLISGPFLVFLASTINGYEGTGRSLSLKLLQQLREQSSGSKKDEKGQHLSGFKGRTLHEIVLEESIRYKPGDQVEAWLNRVLCLDATLKVVSGLPSPEDCELLYVNRDTLFSFHKASETFLHNLMSIYVSAHYKNSPNDLQMLSDAPAHHLFVLIGPVNEKQIHLPDVLAVIQLCLEGGLSREIVSSSIEKGKRGAGDLLPWTVSNQFLDSGFPMLVGARIVRIAVHPDFQSMGYGTRALQLLHQYYEGSILDLDESEEPAAKKSKCSVKNVDNPEALVLLEEIVEPRTDLPPLLIRLNERRAEQIDYIGVSFGLTLDLLKFWKRSSFVPIYIRQSVNSITGEYTCIMLKKLCEDIEANEDSKWLAAYWSEFRQRILNLMSYEFSRFPVQLAISILQLKNASVAKNLSRNVLTREQLSLFLKNSDLHRLSQYARNMIDYHLIMDLLPTLAFLYFDERLDAEVKLSGIQSVILLGIGIQRKSVDVLVSELGLQENQLLALFNKAIKKLSEHLDSICISAIENSIEKKETSVTDMQPMPISLEEDLREAALEIKSRQEKDREKLKAELNDLKQFAIKGSEDDWTVALQDINLQTVKKSSYIVSVKSQFESKGVDLSLLNEKKPLPNRKRKNLKGRC